MTTYVRLVVKRKFLNSQGSAADTAVPVSFEHDFEKWASEHRGKLVRVPNERYGYKIRNEVDYDYENEN